MPTCLWLLSALIHAVGFAGKTWKHPTKVLGRPPQKRYPSDAHAAPNGASAPERSLGAALPKQRPGGARATREHGRGRRPSRAQAARQRRPGRPPTIEWRRRSKAQAMPGRRRQAARWRRSRPEGARTPRAGESRVSAFPSASPRSCARTRGTAAASMKPPKTGENVEIWETTATQADQTLRGRSEPWRVGQVGNRNRRQHKRVHSPRRAPLPGFTPPLSRVLARRWIPPPQKTGMWERA